MSNRNKIESKTLRRNNRTYDSAISRGIQRIPVSTVPPAVLVNILTNPKNKQSGKNRRRLMASRDVVLNVDRTEAKSAASYFARKCSEMTWERLNRKQRRVHRRSDRIISLLQTMAPGSKFRAPLESELSILNLTYKAITNEINLRTAIPLGSI